MWHTMRTNREQMKNETPMIQDLKTDTSLPPAATIGFATPIHDAKEGPLDLNQHLILHPAATYFVRVEGDSMQGAGIFSGDILIVDRSLKVTSGRIVIAVLDGDFTVKRLIMRNTKIILRAENPAYGDIVISYPDRLFVWGVVTYVIHGV